MSNEEQANAYQRVIFFTAPEFILFDLYKRNEAEESKVKRSQNGQVNWIENVNCLRSLNICLFIEFL